MRPAVPLLALLAALLLAGSARAESAGAMLVSGPWRGRALGREAGGGFLLLHGAAGDLRLEFTAAGAADTARLLARRGEGWTVVAGPRGGTRGAWGEPWRPLERRWRALLSEAAGVLAARGGEAFVHRGVVRPDAERSGLRARLVVRGRGRGGPGETLVLRGDREGRVTLTGSRRPGRLVLGPLARREVPSVPPEAYAPLWPLADVLGEREKREPGGPEGVESRRGSPRRNVRGEQR